MLLIIHPLHAAAPKETKRVLIVYSQDKWHPAHELTEQGIRAVFTSNSTFEVKLSAEHLDQTNSPAPAQAQAMADFLRRKYADTKFDAIIAVYPAAVDFLVGENGRLFPGVPIIACEITHSYAEKLEDSLLRSFVTGTILGENISGILEAVSSMKPRTRRIALIAGTTANDIYNEQIFRKGLKSFARRFELIDLTKLSMEETLFRVGALPKDTVILYASIFRDGASKSFVPRDALKLISQAARAPVFGLYNSYLGFGIVGGRLVSFELQGRESARLALRVMMDESPASIAFGGEKAYVQVYDWRELKRWEIPETAIPAGSEIRYRIPTFWEEYRWIVIGSVSLFIIETSLILGLLVTIRQRRLAERSLRDSEAQVRLAAAAAGAGLWSMDREGAQIWATEQARKLFGFTKDEPVNFEKILHVVHPEDQELVRRMMQHAFETAEDTTIEHRVVLPDGAVRWVIVRCSVQRHQPRTKIFLMGTCVDITARKHAEEILLHHQQELVTLTGRLIHNQEEELRRLSRELHDDLTQRLAILAIDAGILEKTVSTQQPEAAAELRELKSRLIEVSNEVHHLSRQLHPSVLDDLGLVQAARAECEDFRRRTGIDLSFTAGGISAHLSPDESLCLYRVLQEALQNMAKHSRAREGHVTIEERPDAIHLLIQDFGTGFDLQQVGGSGGIGLSSMRERVRLVNGTFAIDSAPGEGTEIQVTIPKGGSPHVQTTDTDSR